MFAFLLPLLSGARFFWSIGSAVLGGIGLGRILDLFDGDDENGQALSALVGLVGVLFVALFAVVLLGKKGVLFGSRKPYR